MKSQFGNFQRGIKKLNEQQKKVVRFKEEFLIVKAGPGTGKTRVLVERVAYFVSKKVKSGYQDKPGRY